MPFIHYMLYPYNVYPHCWYLVKRLMDRVGPSDVPVIVNSQRLPIRAAVMQWLKNYLYTVLHMIWNIMFTFIVMLVGHYIINPWPHVPKSPFSLTTLNDVLTIALIGSVIVGLCNMIFWMALTKRKYGHWMGGRYSQPQGIVDEHPVTPPLERTQPNITLRFRDMVFNRAFLHEMVMTGVKFFLVGLIGSAVYIYIDNNLESLDDVKTKGMMVLRVLQIVFAVGAEILLGGAVVWIPLALLQVWLWYWFRFGVDFVVPPPQGR